MKEIELQTLYEAICRWLGFVYYKPKGIMINPDTKERIIPNFLHDRNQQKWIEEKIKELNYKILYYFDDNNCWEIIIWKKGEEKNRVKGYNKSKDFAFLMAVKELIEKEK